MEASAPCSLRQRPRFWSRGAIDHPTRDLSQQWPRRELLVPPPHTGRGPRLRRLEGLGPSSLRKGLPGLFPDDRVDSRCTEKQSGHKRRQRPGPPYQTPEG